MADYCVFCDTRRPQGGTNHLVLNEGKMWLEFCTRCGDSEWLENPLTGERVTVGNLFRRGRNEPAVTPLVPYDEWLADRTGVAIEKKTPEPHHPTLADVWPSH
jgi:hypothetical protein